MCVYGALRNTTSGGLSSSGKVASISIRNWGLCSPRLLAGLSMPGGLGTLGSGAVAAIPAMMLQVRCIGASWADWEVVVLRACAEAVGKAGAGTGGNVFAS